MGAVTVRRHVLSVTIFLLFCFCLWCTWVSSQIVYPKWHECQPLRKYLGIQNKPSLNSIASSSGSRSRSRSRSSVSVNRGNNSMKWTMICTVMSSVLFTLSHVFILIDRMVTASYIGWENNTPETRLSEKEFEKGQPFRYASALVQLFGYCSLIIIFWERLVDIMADTQHSISQTSVIIVRSLIIIGIILILLTPLIHYAFGPEIGVMMAVFPIIIYPLIAIYVVFRFMFGSSRIALGILNHNNNNNNNNGDSNQSRTNSIASNERMIRPLLDGSVRLSLVTFTAVLSTLILSVSYVLHTVVFDNGISNDVFSLLWDVDASVNSLCLMLTFKENKHFYEYLCGSIHEWIILHLLKS